VRDLSTQKERLKTVFQDKIKEFRDKVQVLTGFRVDLPNAPPYNLYNVYPPYRPPTSQYVLTFEADKHGGMQVRGCARAHCDGITSHHMAHRDGITSHHIRTASDARMRCDRMPACSQLLGTQFTEVLGELMETYLQRRDSIPAFLAAVVIKIFDDQL
jgi:hypothetical protein